MRLIDVTEGLGVCLFGSRIVVTEKEKELYAVGELEHMLRSRVTEIMVAEMLKVKKIVFEDVTKEEFIVDKSDSVYHVEMIVLTRAELATLISNVEALVIQNVLKPHIE